MMTPVSFDHRPPLFSNARVALAAIYIQIALLASMVWLRFTGSDIPLGLPILCSLVAVIWIIGGTRILKGHLADRPFIGPDREHSPEVLEEKLEKTLRDIGIWLRARHGFCDQIIMTLDTRAGVPVIYISCSVPLPNGTLEELIRAAREIAPVEGDPRRLLPVRFPTQFLVQKRVDTSSFSAHEVMKAQAGGGEAAAS